MVSSSHPAARRSAMAWLISAGSSPSPRMRLDFVTSPAARACTSTSSDLPYRKPGLICRKMRGTVLPAFGDVGAARLLAHGVQALASHQALQLAIFRAGPQPGLDPRRLTLDGRLAVAGFETEQPAAFGCEYHGSRVRPAPWVTAPSQRCREEGMPR